MKNKILAIVIGIAVIGIGYLLLPTNEEDTLKVTINSWVGFGPLFVAQEAGIFKKYGLDVEIIKIENAPDRRAALLSDRVQIVGSTLDDLAVTLSQGIDAVAFSCADYSNGGDAIIAQKKISSLDSIVHFNIAVQPGFVNHFFLLYVLKSHEIPTKNLRLNPMTPDDAGAAFIAGNVDVAVTWQPHISKAINSESGCNVLASSDQFPEAILDLFVANRKWATSNPEKIGAFRNSWDEALEYIEKNSQDATRVIARNLGLSSDDVKAMFLDVQFLSCEEGRRLVMPKIEELSKDVEEIWREAGYIEKDIDLEKSIILE